MQYRNKNNLLVGVNLNKYPSFEKTIGKLVEQGFKIQNQYKKVVIKLIFLGVLLKIVNSQLEQLSVTDIDALDEVSVQH